MAYNYTSGFAKMCLLQTLAIKIVCGGEDFSANVYSKQVS